MFRAAAFCPHPPMLVPAVASGAAAELDRLRAECTAAIRAACPDGRRPVLLGGGPASRVYPPGAAGTLAPFGVSLVVGLGAAAGEGPPQLPLSLTVGAWLLDAALGPGSGACAFSVGPDFRGSPADTELRELAASADLGLVVLADGSARRSTSAPGYLDERAGGFDASVAAALRSGDPAALAALDEPLGADLLAGGVPAWRAAAAVLTGRRYAAELRYDEAPYGVGYFVAAWTAPAAP